MWFAALGYDWEATGWLPTLLQKLALEEEAVEDLVGKHGIPFKVSTASPCSHPTAPN